MKVISILVLCFLAFAGALNSDEKANRASIVAAARAQIGKTVRYDPSYRALAYPNGDLPIEVGVCTDVVVRALPEGPISDPIELAIVFYLAAKPNRVRGTRLQSLRQDSSV